MWEWGGKWLSVKLSSDEKRPSWKFDISYSLRDTPPAHQEVARLFDRFVAPPLDRVADPGPIHVDTFRVRSLMTKQN